MGVAWTIFCLTVICSGVEARSFIDNKPWIIVHEQDITMNDTVRIECGVPIDYRGGFCHLYKFRRDKSFRSVQTNTYSCEFRLTAKEILGGRKPGSRISVRCNYKLQNFVSIYSDSMAVFVWGSQEKPRLTVNPNVLLMQEVIQIDCQPPSNERSTCRLYRDGEIIRHMPCSSQMTGAELTEWQNTSFYNKIKLTCKYEPDAVDYIRSQPSDPLPVVVIDVDKMSVSQGDIIGATIVCPVPLNESLIIDTTLSLPDGGMLTFEGGDFNSTCYQT